MKRVKLKRLYGPSTHVCWTPDYTPKDKRKMVVLVEAAELEKLESRVIHLEKMMNDARTAVKEL